MAVRYWILGTAGLLALALPLRADGLEDLRKALRALPGQQPVRIHVEGSASGGKDGKQEVWQGGADLEDGPGGLKVKGTLPKGEAAEDPAKWLRAREDLLQVLSLARLEGEGLGTFEGQPARWLRLSLLRGASEEDKALRRFEMTCAFWLDGEGLPRALDLTTDLEGKAAFVSFSTHMVDHRRYRRAGDRLVMEASSLEGEGKAAGTSFRVRRALRGRLLAP